MARWPHIGRRLGADRQTNKIISWSACKRIKMCWCIFVRLFLRLGNWFSVNVFVFLVSFFLSFFLSFFTHSLLSTFRPHLTVWRKTPSYLLTFFFLHLSASSFFLTSFSVSAFCFSFLLFFVRDRKSNKHYDVSYSSIFTIHGPRSPTRLCRKGDLIYLTYLFLSSEPFVSLYYPP